MVIKKQLQVSKSYSDMIENNNKNRIKADLVSAAAVEYYEKNKNNIHLEKIKSDAHQVVFGFELMILTKEEKEKIIDRFREKYAARPGVGAAKVTDAVNILMQALVQSE